MFNYTDNMMDAIELLRREGFAVCAFDPEELAGVAPEDIEERMCQIGWDTIEQLKGHKEGCPATDGFGCRCGEEQEQAA